MPVFLLKNPMIVEASGGEMRASLVSPTTRILIEGVEFQASLMLLNSPTLHVILEMDWLTRHQGQIRCVDRAMTLVNIEGIEVTFIVGTPFHKTCAVHSLKS